MKSIQKGFSSEREQIYQDFLKGHPSSGVRVLIKKLSKLTDQYVMGHWLSTCQGHSRVELLKQICIVAVGGYGRACLLPQSDVDLLVLIPDLDDEALLVINEAIGQWLNHLWDMGIAPSHSVRTISDAIQMCSDDLSTQTAMLESRYLTGDQSVFVEFETAFAEHLDLRSFWREKLAELRGRYARFDDTPYSLEPNCKESPGGLRDLQLMIWLARAAKIGQSWQELHEQGWLNLVQFELIQKSETHLLSIRALLHIVSRRGENRLLFDYQTQLAQGFHIQEARGKRVSEILMQRYYLTARAISQRLQLFLQQFEAHITPQTTATIYHDIPNFPDFREVNHLLDIKDKNVFIRKPNVLLDMFYLYGIRKGLTGCTPQLWDAVLTARHLITPEFRQKNRGKFLRILKMPKGITHSIRIMHQMGVLGRYIPAFRRIMGQMQHDLFHVYTVDQHILTVIRNLRRFTLDEHMHRHELANEVMAEFGRPWLLYIAGLFHDIAKGRGGDHSVLGAKDVLLFAKEHRLSQMDTELVRFLVEKHLLMSQFSQKEDISDIDTITRFADQVESVEKLQALYLLTVADIRGTSPKVWNAWKDQLLADLYRQTLHHLQGKLIVQPESLLQNCQSQALEILKVLNPDYNWAQKIEKLWPSLPMEYFLRQSAHTIAWHIEQLPLVAFDQVDRTEPIVYVAAQPFHIADESNCLQLMVYSIGHEDVFARVCEFFQRLGCSVFDAHIIPAAHGRMLDSFQLLLPDGGRFDPDLPKRIAMQLQEHLMLKLPLKTPVLGRLSARSRNFPIKPSMILMAVGNDEYVLKLTATDRPGVLYSIAHAFALLGIRLHKARIETLGERLEDTFVISSPLLASPSYEAKLEDALIKACTVT